MSTPTLANAAAAAPVATPDEQLGPRFRLPILVPEGTVTRDGRMWEKGSLWWSNGPWPIWALTETSAMGGHDGAVLVGRLDSITRDPQTSVVSAEGRFMLTPEAVAAAKMVADQALRGVSADLAQMKGVQVGPEIQLDDSDLEPDANGVVKLPDEPFDDTAVWLRVEEAEIMGATLCAAPGYKDAGIELLDPVPDAPAGAGVALVASAIPDIGRVVPESRRGALAPVTAAAPVDPPAAWFERIDFDGPTRLTVDDDGRVYGHLATWGTGHRGYLAKQVTCPKSKTGYAHFLTGRVRTADGTDVPTGVLTMGGGHAPTTPGYDVEATKAFYDDVSTGVADLTVWEDAHGLACAGALRPTVTPEQVRALRASAPSGDWRPSNGALELVAVHAVNTPGFPVMEQVLAASGAPLALVASFAVGGGDGEVLVRAGVPDPVTAPVDRTETRIAALEQAIHGPRRAAAWDRIALVRKARALAKIDRVRSGQARARSPRPASTSRPGRDADDSDKHRAAALGQWTEELHPRDDTGKFAPKDGGRRSGSRALSDDEVAAFRNGSAEQHLVTDETGTHFTPEREQLHQQIVDDMLAGQQPQDRPRYNLMGGGPASGKSTMMDAMTPETGSAAVVNADDVKLRLPEYAGRGADAAAFTHEESSYVTRKAVDEAFTRRINVTLDGTGDSSAASLRGKIEQARAAGYSVHGYYVTVPTETAVERAQSRGHRTGRYVPRHVIEGTHRSVSQTLPKVVDRFDTLRVYDNTGKLTLIMEKKRNGQPRVVNQQLWQAFLDKGKG